jgi:hypothetical protein
MATAFSREAPRARPRSWRDSNSWTKPKVLAAAISRVNEPGVTGSERLCFPIAGWSNCRVKVTIGLGDGSRETHRPFSSTLTVFVTRMKRLGRG